MKIAVLGTGRMGQALAGRLMSAGHTVTVWNRTPGKASDLVDRGAREATSIADAVGDAGLALTMLSNDDAVLAVALGDDGVRASLPDGATYVDCSTVAPATSTRLAGAFAQYVAMPVLGSPPQVSAGEATFLIGGDDAAAASVDALFPGLSEKSIRYPRPELASAAKLTVNLMLLDGIVALAEAFGVGRAGGLSDDDLQKLLGSSPMVAPGLKSRFDGVLSGSQDPWWTAGLGGKDAGLAVELARSAGLDLPLTETARDRYREVAARSDTDDIAAVSKLYRS